MMPCIGNLFHLTFELLSLLIWNTYKNSIFVFAYRYTWICNTYFLKKIIFKMSRIWAFQHNSIYINIFLQKCLCFKTTTTSTVAIELHFKTFIIIRVSAGDLIVLKNIGFLKTWFRYVSILFLFIVKIFSCLLSKCTMAHVSSLWEEVHWKYCEFYCKLSFVFRFLFKDSALILDPILLEILNLKQYRLTCIKTVILYKSSSTPYYTTNQNSQNNSNTHPNT